MDELYKEEILQHYRHPQNFGKLKRASVNAYKLNPLCGDEIELQLYFQNGKVKDVAFYGSGCALSTASASLFTESLKGKSLAQLKRIKPESLQKNLGVKVSPSRLKCINIPYDALKELQKKLPKQN